MHTTLTKWILSVFLLPLAPLFANTAYLGEGTTLTLLDTATNSITGTIPQGGSVVLIAITPDNRFAYVTEANDSVAVIDTATNTVFTTISLAPGSAPIGIAITPNGQFAYVADQNNGTVSIISIATNQVVGAIPGFVDPWGIAITPNGQFAYVVDLNGGVSPGYVSVIDLSTNTIVVPSIVVERGPTAIAITPDGLQAYVTNENDNSVSVISTASNTVIATIAVGINPFQVAVSPNGQFVYVSNNAYTSITNSSVSVISTATNSVVATIPLDSSGPADLAVTPDGQTLYVTSTIGTYAISTATNQVLDLIPGAQSSIAITGTLVANLAGRQNINDFGVVYEYFNHLQWEPTPFSGVIGYHIYRNGVKIADLSANTFQYDDHNQKKNVPVTYSVVPVDASGQESTPLTVVIG